MWYYRDKAYANMTRINILIVPKPDVVNFWRNTSFNHINRWNFRRNFGIDVDYYGSPISGQRCLHGFERINFKLSSSSSSATFLLFEVSNGEVTGVKYEGIDQFLLYTQCFGYKGASDEDYDYFPIVTGFLLGVVVAALIILGAFCYYRKDCQEDEDQFKVDGRQSVQMTSNPDSHVNHVYSEDFGEIGNERIKEKKGMLRK